MAAPLSSSTQARSPPMRSRGSGPTCKLDYAKELLDMPRNAPAPLGANIVTVRRGPARPLGEARPPAASEERVGITIRLPVSVHEKLRVLAFEQRTSKQQLIEGWIANQLTKVERSHGA